MRTVCILIFAACVVGFVLPMNAQGQTWANWEITTYEQQGESLFVAITFVGDVREKGLIHAGATFFNDYDDNPETGQSGNVGSETNLTFCEWDADNIWSMRVYGLWDHSMGTFVYRALTPVQISADGKTISYKHSLVGLDLEDLSYWAQGYWLDGSNWWNDPWNLGDQLEDVQLYSFNTTLVPVLDKSLTGTKSRLEIPDSYKSRAESENIIDALDEIVNLIEAEIGVITPSKPYTVTYNPYSDYPVFVYVTAPNNTFTTYIPGTQWVDEPNWWAMIEGAVYQTMAERSAGYREIFMTTMATDIPLPETADGWYTTNYDSTHGLKWTTNNKVTFKAILGRAFHNLITIYVGEQLSHAQAKAAATTARTRAVNAYTEFSGDAFDLDPWIMTGFLMDKIGSDLEWTKRLWDALPVTFQIPDDESPGDTFGQMVKPFLRDGVADGSLPYATRKYWYQNIASVQAGAIDAATDADIYMSLKAIANYPTVDSVYNLSKAVFSDLLTNVEEHGTGIVADFNVAQNYPNPFNPSTRIAFTIPERAYTTIQVFDVLGREVARLLNEELTAGEYEVNWNATGLPSGVYLYRVQSGNYITVRKAILLK
jgi:hypothetical protein